MIEDNKFYYCSLSDVLFLGSEVDIARQHGRRARQLFRVLTESLLGAGGELIGHDSVHVGQHVHKLHFAAVVLKDDAQSLDEPRAFLVVAPGV